MLLCFTDTDGEGKKRMGRDLPCKDDTWEPGTGRAFGEGGGECCYDTHCWHAAQVSQHRVTHVSTTDLETEAGSAIWVSSLRTSGRGARAALQIQGSWLLDGPRRQGQYNWVLIKRMFSAARLCWVVLEEISLSPSVVWVSGVDLRIYGKYFTSSTPP